MGANAGDDAGRLKRRDRIVAWGFSAVVHLSVLAALFWPRPAPPPAKPEPSTLMVSVAEKPKPPGPPMESEPGGRSEVKPEMPQPIMPTFSTVAAPDNSDLLSDSQIAGASGVGEGGGGGGGCDLGRAAEQALRRDRLVGAAVADAGRLGKASMLWDGDWVRAGDQDGKGLAAVRQAIQWEVGFSPAACRNQPMHGVVVLSLADGRTRFAIGTGAWRWSDLLGLKNR